MNKTLKKLVDELRGIIGEELLYLSIKILPYRNQQWVNLCIAYTEYLEKEIT